MKTHGYTLIAALLASPALLAPAYAEAKPGSTGYLVGDLLKLEQESWDHFKFFFNTYAKMCNKQMSQKEAIDTMYASARRVDRIAGIIYSSCHTPDDDKIRPFKEVIREAKFREGIALRDKTTRAIVEHIKENNYYNSDKLKKATEHLLAAIATTYMF